MERQGVFEIESGKNYLRLSAKQGRLTMMGGIQRKVRGKKPTCRICGKQVLEGDPAIFIHPIGEIGKDFHAKCARLLGAALGEVASYAISKATGNKP